MPHCPFPLIAYYNIDQKLIIFVVVSQKNSEQVTEHRCNVLEILQKYLKGTKHTIMYISKVETWHSAICLMNSKHYLSSVMMQAPI